MGVRDPNGSGRRRRPPPHFATPATLLTLFLVNPLDQFLIRTFQNYPQKCDKQGESVNVLISLGPRRAAPAQRVAPSQLGPGAPRQKAKMLSTFARGYIPPYCLGTPQGVSHGVWQTCKPRAAPRVARAVGWHGTCTPLFKRGGLAATVDRSKVGATCKSGARSSSAVGTFPARRPGPRARRVPARGAVRPRDAVRRGAAAPRERRIRGERRTVATHMRGCDTATSTISRVEPLAQCVLPLVFGQSRPRTDRSTRRWTQRQWARYLERSSERSN